MKTVFLSLMLVAVAGCAVGPKCERPEAAMIPATYSGATNEWKVAEPQAHLPKGSWWEMFSDADLNGLETDAAEANQQLKAAAARFVQARAVTDATRSGLFPHIGLSGSVTRQRNSPNAPGAAGSAVNQTGTFDNFEVPLDLSYELDLWGRVRHSVESARAQEQADAADLEAVKLAIQAEVASDYFALRALDTEQAILRSSVEVFRKSLELTRNRRAGGIVSDLDVAQSETVLRTTQAQLPAIGLQRAKFEHALAVLTGRTAIDFKIAERTVTDAPPIIPPGLPSELLERRPDISAAERRMAAANASIGVAKAAFFPTVRFSGLAGFQSLDAGTLFNWPSRLWAVGPSLTLPLFEGGRLRANLRLAKASYDETVANYRENVLTGFAEVEDNLAAQTLLAQQYEEQSAALQAAHKQMEIASNRYRDGLITYLEVATAETTALNIERETVQLRGQQLVSTVALIKALGGGWDNADVSVQQQKAEKSYAEAANDGR